MRIREVINQTNKVPKIVCEVRVLSISLSISLGLCVAMIVAINKLLACLFVSDM